MLAKSFRIGTATFIYYESLVTVVVRWSRVRKNTER